MGFALKIAGTKKSEIEQRVREAAVILELESFLDRKPKALSGGNGREWRWAGRSCGNRACS